MSPQDLRIGRALILTVNCPSLDGGGHWGSAGAVLCSKSHGRAALSQASGPSPLLLAGTCPTPSWPHCVLPSSPWSTAPPAFSRPVTWITTSTSLWMSGPAASASRRVSICAKGRLSSPFSSSPLSLSSVRPSCPLCLVHSSGLCLVGWALLSGAFLILLCLAGCVFLFPFLKHQHLLCAQHYFGD